MAHGCNHYYFDGASFDAAQPGSIPGTRIALIDFFFFCPSTV
jgi:hypothetical protein